ncbi:unnamed protein product [[Candida] boidinii]|nr:unnamed protein product [[Candida] boidinii]
MVLLNKVLISILALASASTATYSNYNQACSIDQNHVKPGFNCKVYKYNNDKCDDDYFYSGYKNHGLIGYNYGCSGTPYYKGNQKSCFGVNLKSTYSYTTEFTAYYYADEDGFHDVSISVGGEVNAAIYFGNGGFECCDHDDTNVELSVTIKRIKKFLLLMLNAHLENMLI